MKKHVIKTAKAELLIFELPRVCDYELTKEGLFVKEHGSNLPDYIEGSYTLLGKSDEISEEDAMELVESTDFKGFDLYWDYINKRWFDESMEAKDSLLSLIESEIFWENPYEKPETCFMETFQTPSKSYEEFYLEWQEAEQKTFDKSRSLIFKKNN